MLGTAGSPHRTFPVASRSARGCDLRDLSVAVHRSSRSQARSWPSGSWTTTFRETAEVTAPRRADDIELRPEPVSADARAVLRSFMNAAPTCVPSRYFARLRPETLVSTRSSFALAALVRRDR